jgi:peptide/nickel transport system permease protein
MSTTGQASLPSERTSATATGTAPSPLAQTKAAQWRIGLKRARRRLARDPLAMLGVTITAIVVITCIFAPLIATHDPTQINIRAKLQPPSLDHFFGTDETGRDLFSRMVYGARLSLLTGITILLVTIVIGSTLGAIAGYVGGKVDAVIMRVADFFIAFPFLILAMMIAFTLGASTQNAVYAVIFVFWPSYARLVRNQVVSIRHREFVDAARVAGSSNARIIFKHVLPQTRSSLIIQFSLDLGFAIVAISTLGFIGLGAQPPTPEWGTIIAQSRSYALDKWWYGLLPGLVVTLTVIGFNLVGDFVQELLESPHA